VSSVTPTSYEYFVPGLHEAMPETRTAALAGSGEGFLDTLLDIVNPLQHIPGVSTVYRHISGDTIAAPARLIGGALFGGPLGFASAAANLVIEQATGDDLDGHLVALFEDLEAPSQPTIATAPPAASADNVASAATSEQASDIVWNGPRVVPALARGEPLQADPPAAIPTGETADAGPVNAGPVNAGPANAGPANAGPANAGTADNPPWLQAAIADATALHRATEAGSAPPPPTAQPWVADAMLEALAKYEEMARERNQ